MIIALPKILTAKIVNGTRSTAGVHVVTGVGFKPSGIIMLSNIADWTLNLSIGFCDGTSQSLLQISESGTTADSDFTLISNIYKGAATYMSAVCDSFDNDGFTLTWTKLGTISVEYTVMCLR